MNLRPLFLLPALAAAAHAVPEPAKVEGFPPMPPVQPKSVEESMKTVQLPPGYRLEAVLAEPQIAEPVALSFDGDGRMFVVEMRTYMQDIDGTGEHEPKSRVSLHEDTDGDGRYDKHTVFADKLLLPRMVLPLGKGQAVIGETDTLDLYLWTDADGDGVAEKKERWWEGGPRGGNMEHQPSGLVWSTDNWIYTTYNAFRLRWTPQGVVKEPTAPNGGQWGVSQDDWGKQWFVNAGGEKGPVNFQTPIAYGAFNVADQFAPDFDVVWPLVGIPDVQGGDRRFRPEEKTLNHFTATCGGEIYRGDRLPAELKGDLFFGEPVGRLARRTKMEVKDGLTFLSNPHGQSEFMRATDPLFRPMQFANAPDGTLYCVDMYRGIIQEGNWVKEGSYLRKVVQQYSLDKPIGRGRIYRLVHDTTKRDRTPKMHSETPAQLVAHLAHPNGWWRDTAQKLIILQQDKSVVPTLTEMARTHAEPLARLHALWTLEGLGAATPDLVREKMKDAHPQLRASAIRVSETLYKAGDQSLAPDLLAMTNDADATVIIQSILSAKRLELPDWKKNLPVLANTSPIRGVKEIGSQILNPPVPTSSLKNLTSAEQKLFKDGENTYQTLCSACHGLDGKGMPMLGAAPGSMLAPALAGSKTITSWKEGAIYVLLHGLVGDIDGKKYEGQMIPMANNSDDWIAGVISYVRNSFGNRSGFVTGQEVAALRAATKDRTQPWTIEELRKKLPQPLARDAWKLSASHATGDCGLAIDGKPETRYTTKKEQTPGMWLQIELPTETTVLGLELEATKSPGDYPNMYTVELSADGQQWSKPVASGKGSVPDTLIHFPPSKAKFIRINQTGAMKGRYWSIHELQVFTTPLAAK